MMCLEGTPTCSKAIVTHPLPVSWCSLSISWTPGFGDAQGQGCVTLKPSQVLVPGYLSPRRGAVLEGQDTLPRALSQGGHLNHVRDSPATGPVPPFSVSLGALSTRGCLRGWQLCLPLLWPCLPAPHLAGYDADSTPVCLL